MKTHQKNLERILRDAYEKGLLDAPTMSPAELGKAIQEEYDANPPSLKERVWAHLYAFQLRLKKGK